MREKDLCMLKQMLELSESNVRKFVKEAPNSFINFLCECLLNVINGNVPVKKQLLKNEEDSFQRLLSKETSLKKAIYFCEKILIRTYQGNRILVLSLLESQKLHAEEFFFDPQENVHIKKFN